jgi:hypothetical protein
LASRRYAAAAGVAHSTWGRRIRNVVPCPGALSTSIEPRASRTMRATVARHRIARVHDEIHQNLIELRRVDSDLHRTRFQIESRVDAATGQSIEHRSDALDRVAERHHARNVRLVAAEGEELAAERRTARPGVYDVAKVRRVCVGRS